MSDSMPYHQQLHLNCGGEICIVALKGERGPNSVQFCCKACRVYWNMNLPAGMGEFSLPAEWFGYEPEGSNV